MTLASYVKVLAKGKNKSKDDNNPLHVDVNSTLPLDLGALLFLCEKKYGYSYPQMFDIVNRLYCELHAITCYRAMRRFLLDEQYLEAPQIMRAVIQNMGYNPNLFDLALRSEAFNSGEAYKSLHTAIIPKDARINLDAVPEPERNVYGLIAQYYAAQFIPPQKRADFLGSSTNEIPLGDK